MAKKLYHFKEEAGIEPGLYININTSTVEETPVICLKRIDSTVLKYEFRFTSNLRSAIQGLSFNNGKVSARIPASDFFKYRTPVKITNEDVLLYSKETVELIIELLIHRDGNI